MVTNLLFNSNNTINLGISSFIVKLSHSDISKLITVCFNVFFIVLRNSDMIENLQVSIVCLQFCCIWLKRQFFRMQA